MTPRQTWFINRIIECIQELNILAGNDYNWIEYKEKAHEIACELLYATTEWDKYYKDVSYKNS